jgi:hypothetical protein
MSEEQQRIAIAEACHPVFTKGTDGEWYFNSPYEGLVIFDLNDLNAMHEAEKILIRPNLYAKGGWDMYLRNLAIVTDEQHPIDATAAQRAEAFLRTINKWEKTKL